MGTVPSNGKKRPVGFSARSPRFESGVRSCASSREQRESSYFFWNGQESRKRTRDTCTVFSALCSKRLESGRPCTSLPPYARHRTAGTWSKLETWRTSSVTVRRSFGSITESGLRRGQSRIDDLMGSRLTLEPIGLGFREYEASMRRARFRHRRKSARKLLTSSKISGGERGIRTLDRVSPIHAFQACAFNHSAISPGSTVKRGRSRPRPSV